MTGHVRSLSSRSDRLDAGRELWRYRWLQGLKSEVTLVLCIHAGLSELLNHDDWGGIPCPQERHSLRPVNGAEWPQRGQSQYSLAYHERLPSAKSKVGRYWGHTPVWTGRGRALVGKEGVFVVIRGVPKATADARATRGKVSPYVWEVGVRWTDIPNVQSQKCVSPHL